MLSAQQLTAQLQKIRELRVNLCHPGVTRLLHFVKTKNLPYSTEDVKKVCGSCKFCAEIKPQFYCAPINTLTKATQPMERLSVDFKVLYHLLPITNTFLLLSINILDSLLYSRVETLVTSSSSVIKYFDQLFVLFDLPKLYTLRSWIFFYVT